MRSKQKCDPLTGRRYKSNNQELADARSNTNATQMSTWSEQLEFWTNLVNHHSQWRTRTLLACVDRQCLGIVSAFHLRATSTIASIVKRSVSWAIYSDWVVRVMIKGLAYPSPPKATGEPVDLMIEANYQKGLPQFGKFVLVSSLWSSERILSYCSTLIFNWFQ